MSEEQQRVLKAQLWKMACDMRGNMNASDFMNYGLGLIFYKYLSERIELYVNNELKNDKLRFAEAWANEDDEFKNDLKEAAIEEIGYFLEPEYLFSTLVAEFKVGGFILETLGRAFKHIEDSTLSADSQDDFQNLFDDVDLTSAKLGKTADDKNKLIGNLLLSLSDIDFLLEDAEIDILGDAYEYMIGEFAAGAGQKAGEFYTPQAVSKILARIVTTNKKRLRNVFDPTCGSGSLLLRVAKEGRAEMIYGQEKNPTTFNLARMNMMLHNLRYDKFDIRSGDSLEDDQFERMTFDAIVANPPFSANWSADSKFNSDDRFSRAGALAPKSKADYAFILHMVNHLGEGGTMACVAPHGVLFRGAAEGKIRKYLVETKNYIDAVIGLPANLFYGTSIPTCILVLKKCRKDDEDILFIDASKNFEKIKTQNQLREEDVIKIVDTYRSRKEIEKYSHKANLDEIRGHDFNLNIPRYVDTFEAEEEIDIDRIAKEYRDTFADMAKVDKEIAGFCTELGITNPFEAKKDEQVVGN